MTWLQWVMAVIPYAVGVCIVIYAYCWYRLMELLDWPLFPKGSLLIIGGVPIFFHDDEDDDD